MAALDDYLAALSSIESGGNYNAVGPSTSSGDQAYGKYQVMGSNVPAWTKAATGTALTPDQFLKDPDAQEATAKNVFGGYVSKYGNPQDAASKWFSGRPMAQAMGATDGYNTVPQYVDKFNKALAGQTGNATMPDPTQPQPAQPPMQQAMQPQPSTLFGGNPTPVGGLGYLAKSLGIGSEPELGRRLQNAGAALISINDPKGGAALQNAANQPHYNVVTDALGNRYMVDTRTGQPTNQTTNGAPAAAGGVAPGGAAPSQAAALAQSPIALAKQAELNAEASTKKMSDLEDAASAAQAGIDQNKQALALSQDPNVVQGPGIMNMLKEKTANLTNGSLGGVDVAKQGELDKLNSQLVSTMLSAQKGIRFAAPEIKFGETASADTEKPAATNQQIYNNNIQNFQRIIDARDLAREHYYTKTPGLLGSEYSTALQGYQAQHPVYQATTVQPTKQGATSASRPPLTSFEQK